MSMITCPTCGSLSAIGKKFCAECGTALTSTETSSAALAVTVPETVAAPPVLPPAEERRLVTILFADLVGSTSLGDSLDPDALYELTDLAHKQLETCVHRYAGHVARHLGDGMMVLFGAPLAHEDDAERAVLAALEMQRALATLDSSRSGSPPLGMRIGITSGEVVAATMAGIYEVIGDAANVAARLQGAAEIGEVLVGEETRRLARRRITFGQEQRLVLKGKPELVAAYAVVGVREQLGERWEGIGRDSSALSLIGREQELGSLTAAWATAQNGKGQLLTLIGEAGVGKSRLLAEVMEKISTGGDRPHRLLRGRCLSYGQSVSLWLIADLVRTLCALHEEERLETVGQRIAATVDEVLCSCDETDRGIAMDVLGEVLGLPIGGSMVASAGPQFRRQSLIRALGLLLTSLAETGPVLLILEDLHWVDTASQEILTEVLLASQGLPLLVVAVTRPGWHAPWSDWEWTEQMPLAPLPDADAAILAGAVLGGMVLSQDLAEHIRERAAGNPFFVEELLRYLQESGGLEQRDESMALVPGIAEKLPNTLTEVLLARLDRLESQVKGVAQVGSVIGRSFAVRLLCRVMEREEEALTHPLQALQRAEITLPQVGSEPEHVFKHALLRDAAYGMLVQRRKRQLHLQTARAIASLYPSDEYVEMIAYHYARTEEDGEAAEWLERAGDRATAAYANEAAIEHFQAALDRLERCRVEPISLAGIAEKLGEALRWMNRLDEAEEVLQRAVERYRGLGDLEGAGGATAALGRISNFQGKLEDGLRQVGPMIDALEGRGPSAVLAALVFSLTDLFQNQGRYEEMLAATTRTAELAEGIGDEGLGARAQANRATALGCLGRIEESRQAFEEVIPVLERRGDLPYLMYATSNLSFNHWIAGEVNASTELSEQALMMAERIGHVMFQIANHLELSVDFTMIGQWDRAREHLTRAEEIARVRGNASWLVAKIPSTQGLLSLREGDWGRARERLNRAVHLATGVSKENLEEAVTLLAELDILDGRAEEARNRLTELLTEEGADLPLMLPILAWVEIDLGETQRGLELAERAEREIRERQALFYLPEALRIKGMALAQLERAKEARTALNEGHERAAAMPHPYMEARILVELELLGRSEGEQEQGVQELEEALAIFRQLGAKKDVVRVEELLDSRDG